MEIKEVRGFCLFWGGFFWCVFYCVFLKKWKNLFWNEQRQVTCSSGNVDLIQQRQPSQQLLGIWQTHKFKARQDQTFINDYHHIFTEILKIFVKNFSWNVHSLDTCHHSGWTSADVLACLSRVVFCMVSIETPLPEPRIKVGGKEIIEYILCELAGTIWILPAFELCCCACFLLWPCSSVSRAVIVPSRVPACWARSEPARRAPGGQRCVQGRPALPALRLCRRSADLLYR